MRASLGQLLPDLALPPQAAAIIPRGLALDSRTVEPGELFIGVPGHSDDGRRHIRQALAAGACAALVEADDAAVELRDGDCLIRCPDLGANISALAARFHGWPGRRLNVLGVTGSNGKTSVALWLASALADCGMSCACLGTLGYSVHLRADDGGADSAGATDSRGLTTPDALRVQQLMADSVAAGCDALAMEVSSHSLVQGRVAAVEFDMALFTNLSHEHLDYHGDMDSYGAAKAALFEMPGLGCAVINMDDEWGRRIRAGLGDGVRVLGVSLDGAADVHLRGGDDRRLCIAMAGGDCLEVRLQRPLPCTHQWHNLMMVAAALQLLGVDRDAMHRALGRLPVVPGRMEAVSGAPLVLVDYAHSPDALRCALRALRERLAEGARLHLVFGCGGERDRGKRPMMAAIAEQLADCITITSDNPRSEDPGAIARDMLDGMDAPGDALVELDRRRAIERALDAMAADDMLLVAGKGHEQFQEVAGRRLPLCDRQLVREILGMGEGGQ